MGFVAVFSLGLGTIWVQNYLFSLRRYVEYLS